MQKTVIGLSLVAALGLCAVAHAEEKKDAEAIKIGGFVEGAFKAGSGSPQYKGFTLSDGAIYISKQFGQGELKFDIPVFYDKAGSSNLLVGQQKAQAYVAYKYNNGMRWKLGMFDTLFGFEGTDSIDRRFSEFGLVSSVLPTVQGGATVGYDYGEAIGVTMMVANPSDTGVLSRNNPQVAAQVTMNHGVFRGSLGGAWQKDKTMAEKANNLLLNAVVGATVGELSTDVEFDLVQKAGIDDKTWGVAGHFGYNLIENLEAGLRLEYLKNGIIESAFAERRMQGTVGAGYKLNKDISVRGDYTLLNTKALATADSDNGHGVILSVVAKF